MTDKELDAMIESLGQFFDPDMAFFAEVNGEAIGFILGIPDFNIVLHKVQARPGVPEIWSLIKAGWYWKVRPIMDRIRIPLMGVQEEYRDKGVDVALYYSVLEQLRHTQYFSSDGGWVLETNNLIPIIEKFGGKNYKTHRVYEKKFNTSD